MRAPMQIPGYAPRSPSWRSRVSARPGAFAESHPEDPSNSATAWSANPEMFPNPNGIAVDESTGDVYVAEIGTQTVSKFDVCGRPVDFSDLVSGSNALTGIPHSPANRLTFSFPGLVWHPGGDRSR